MSVTIQNNVIRMTRGDTAIIKVQLWKKMDGECIEYKPVEGDVVRFALKHNSFNSTRTELSDVEPLLVKEIPIDTMMLTIEPEDTKELGFGGYLYDVQITFASGVVDTFIPEGRFSLTPEVD